MTITAEIALSFEDADTRKAFAFGYARAVEDATPFIGSQMAEALGNRNPYLADLPTEDEDAD